MNDIYVNSGIFSQFHSIRVPIKLKKLMEQDPIGLVVYGDRENTVRFLSLAAKYHIDNGIMMPSPQVAGMAKVYEHQKKAYKDSESADLMLNRVLRPPWLGLYYFDQVLAKMFDADINTAFRYWFTSALATRALSKASTVLAAEPMFKKNKLFQFFVPKDWAKLCGGKVLEVDAKDYV